MTVQTELQAAFDEIEAFERSVGQSDTERDVLSVMAHVRVRGWRARHEKHGLSEAAQLAVFALLARLRAFNAAARVVQ